LLSGPRARAAGVQLAFWGRVLPGEALELTLGLPAASLAPLGLRDLPAGYVFAIPIRGTARQPKIDWIKCAARAPPRRSAAPCERPLVRRVKCMIVLPLCTPVWRLLSLHGRASTHGSGVLSPVAPRAFGGPCLRALHSAGALRPTCARPRRRAAAQLTEMVVKHRVGQDLPFLRGLLSRPRKAPGGEPAGADAPQPLEPFPWAAAAGAAGGAGAAGEAQDVPALTAAH